MRRLGCTALVVALGILGLGGPAYPCAALRATARIETFTCPCDDGSGGNLETPIYVVTGMLVATNGRAAPTLGSLVVEIQAREGRRYVPAAWQVLNGSGASSVQTCVRTFAAGPVPGRIVLVDGDGNELTFDEVKSLPRGMVALKFVATFAGPIPGLDAGEQARIKVYTTAIGVDAPRTCTIDANGDGSNDLHVKTLVFRKLVRVPRTASLITP